MKERYSQDELHVLVAERNSNNYTYDGIEVGGERLAQEIEDELLKLEKRCQKITRLSIVGYSMGGLIARYSVGLLFSRGLFDKLEPVNFTAFASPFLGVRAPIKGYHSYLWNVLGGRMLSISGQQLFLMDSFRDTGRSLLEVMTDPKSIFITALKKFKHRTLYANIINDRSAPWYTTGVTRSDPFVDLDAVTLNYMKGYDSVMLDPDNPVEFKNKEAAVTLYKRLVSGGSGLLTGLPYYTLMTLLSPVFFSAFIVNAGIQTMRSAQRIQLHNNGKAGSSFDIYRIPYMLESVLNSKDVEDHLTEGETAEIDAAMASERHEQGRPPSPVLYRTRSRPDFPVLALDPRQFRMIETLNEVGWKKFPVHISKVRHSHAAIIVRRKGSSFDEGWVVIKHWLDNEFEL